MVVVEIWGSALKIYLDLSGCVPKVGAKFGCVLTRGISVTWWNGWL